MTILVLLRALTPRSQISTRLSSYESVFRNVNTPMVPWAGFAVDKTLSLGSRALCSKLDIVAQNETKILSVSNPTKIVFNYVCAGDEPLKNSKCFKTRKIIETPTGDALFKLSKGGGVIADMIADSIPSRINSVSEYLTIPCDVDNFVSNCILEIMRNGDRVVVNSDTGRIKLTLDLDDFLVLRIWEIITNGDKTVLEIIVGELRRNGFDFTEDPLALQKFEQSVERAIARVSNAIKLNLPDPAGPEVSTIVSWGTSDGCFISCSTSGDF